MEVWKSIEDYEGLYEISNLGNVKSLNYKHTKKEGILAKCNNRNGYLTVNLFKNRKVKTRRIHQLVALAFLNHKPCGYELVINHINHIKTDNRLENLEIVTHRENSNKKHIKSFSQYTGVYWCKRTNKWLSQITINKKRNHLGYFDTEIEAHNAYQNKLLTLNK